MRGKAIPLERKLEDARARFARREEREKNRQAVRNQKYFDRLQELERRFKHKAEELKKENARLRVRAGVQTMAYPTPAQRVMIKKFRLERRWKVGRMAKFCECQSRQINQIESEDRSIYLSRVAFGRIMERIGQAMEIDEKFASEFTPLELKLLAQRGVQVPGVVMPDPGPYPGTSAPKPLTPEPALDPESQLSDPGGQLNSEPAPAVEIVGAVYDRPEIAVDPLPENRVPVPDIPHALALDDDPWTF